MDDFTEVTREEVMGVAATMAFQEAQARGYITEAQLIETLTRAKELAEALFDGKMTEPDGNGFFVIVDGED